MSPKRLYIAGTRTFSAEVLDFAEAAGFDVAGLLEPADRERPGSSIHGQPVTWLDESDPEPEAVAIVGTGEPLRRPVVERLRARRWQLATLIHPDARLASNATVGAGSIIGPGVIVGAMSEIGENVVLGRGSLVGHHTAIGELATVGPGANVAGNTTIGAEAFLGMGSMVRDHVKVGSRATVAMGAVVVENVAPDDQVRGVPARSIR